MKLHIEKSAFRKGEYVGYCLGSVYVIKKTNSSYGNWIAFNRNNFNDYLYAFTLQDMDNKLAKHQPLL